MSPIEIAAIVAMVGYSIFKQTQVSEVTGQGRFKMAIIYGIVGLVSGGFAAPHGAVAVGFIAVSLLLSLIIGYLRGRWTTMWVEPDGRVMKKGTALTVGLFLGLVVAKFALGAVAYEGHVHDGAGFGEVMVMIAIMIAVQAELVWRRGQAMGARPAPAKAAAAR